MPSLSFETNRTFHLTSRKLSLVFEKVDPGLPVYLQKVPHWKNNKFILKARYRMDFVGML